MRRPAVGRVATNGRYLRASNRCQGDEPSTEVRWSVVSLEERLRVVPEFRPDEHGRVRELLLEGKLGRRLSRWAASDVELEISVKDRDTSKQRMALECWISKVPRMVATSTRNDLEAAVLECRDDLYRQVDRFVTKKEAERRR